ncbi:hypothetical protein KOW79_012660 [Hemibagrus wyckioides]|uniref:Ig-like domain-containing protein n=1 Tax=Hemibagrus wyckioides TaxID=337641 RepID=A0A9D3NMJ1_9TELE|nr:hypothetical protein KOW79_012660 [Hemibagrus wyckioides]
MAYFLILCIVCNLICVKTKIIVSGCVGSMAALPCELQHKGPERPHIRWFTDAEIVFERWGKAAYKGKKYEGRADVPEEKLCKGNCSLVLQNLILTDAAVYRSYKVVRRTKRCDTSKRSDLDLNLISSVTLSVSVCLIKETNKNISPTPSGDAGMKCPHLLVMVLSLHLMFTCPALQ